MSNPNSCLPKLNTGIDLSQYEIEQANHNLGTNQLNFNLIKNNSSHNSVWLNPFPRCLAFHCYEIKQTKIRKRHNKLKIKP